jgi:hypothetical protein
VSNVAAIGSILEEVRCRLARPFFLQWLQSNLGWCEQTANNYIGVARLVNDNPKVLEVRSLVLLYRLPSLPDRTREAIIERNPSIREAQEIIDSHRREDWADEVEALFGDESRDFSERSGDALRMIEQAMDDPALREEAKRLALQHAARFAALADTDEPQLLAAMGLSLGERLPEPAAGRVKAQLVENTGGSRLVVWVVGEAHTVAFFPEVSDPAAAAWQAAVIRSAVKLTRARTIDDLCVAVI